jgi:hypothetical protein
MTATQVEWTYDSVNGEIIDVYLFPSEIIEIPMTDGDLFEIACYDSLADLEARNLVDGY